jgi:hypothetical protein
MKIRDDNEEGTKQQIPPLDITLCGLNYSCEFHQSGHIYFQKKKNSYFRSLKQALDNMSFGRTATKHSSILRRFEFDFGRVRAEVAVEYNLPFD